ncbi:MAG: hypothetical protein FWD90_01730 [Defluviitaleaceae bacterium]|nr:hypothetical protein [Defluviitaleaceae bacterium]
MFLSKKFKRGMTREQADAIIEKSRTEEPLELEKGDLPAMIIAAFVVFFPFVLVFCGILGFIYWFIFHVWAG